MRLQFCVLWFSWWVTVVMWCVGGDHNSVHVSCLKQSIGEGIQPNICLYSPVGIIQSRSSSSNKHTITTIPNHTSYPRSPNVKQKPSSYEEKAWICGCFNDTAAKTGLAYEYRMNQSTIHTMKDEKITSWCQHHLYKDKRPCYTNIEPDTSNPQSGPMIWVKVSTVI